MELLYYRDMDLLLRSLKTLRGYIELSKQGRLEFMMDIPTQLFKVFFDRNIHNDKSTLFERVFPNDEVYFHPLDKITLTIVDRKAKLDKWRIFSHGGGLIYPNPDDIGLKLFHIKAPRKLSFTEWKDQVLSDTVYFEASNVEHVPVDDDKIVDSLLQTVSNPLSSHLSWRRSQALWKWQGYEDIEFQGLDNYETPPTTNNNGTHLDLKLVQLTIEDFVRLKRHKDSAHADPMDNPKWQDEYDKLNITKDIHQFPSKHSQFTGDLEFAIPNEEFNQHLIDIAEYLVWRLEDELEKLNGDSD